MDHRKTIITDEAKQMLKQILNGRRRKRPEDDPNLISAVDIAERLGWQDMPHESKRRAVRKLVAAVRAEGFAIASNLTGYWVAETAQDHADYQAHLKRMGLSHLVQAAKDRRSSAAADASGQLSMFPEGTLPRHRF